MDIRIIQYVLEFIGIWFGSGLVISSVEKFSHKLKLSAFSVSFLILGLFTSLSEISVGINSVLDKDPEIFVGNLIGASIVLFLLVIPLLAIADKQIKIGQEFQGLNLITSLVVIAIPVLLTFDGVITSRDGVISLVAFGVCAFLIESKRGFLKNPTILIQSKSFKILPELLKIAIGAIIIFVCSALIVDQTIYFSQALQLSPFFISLMMISVGTNLPELSLVVRSIFFKDSKVAFGDFIGSAVYNTLIFGSLVLWNGQSIYLNNSYHISLLILMVGLFLFYLFAKSKNSLTRKEGLILFVFYFIFLALEISSHL